MGEFVLKGHGGHAITDWRSWTAPKRPYHWRGGRSAMELARAWFVSPVPACPREVADLLASHSRTADVTLLQGIPEHVTSLPERGEGRNHDLLLYGNGAQGGVVVSIEAKVDEPFGDTIGGYWSKAGMSDVPTRAPERIAALLAMLFGTEASPDADPWHALRYQLMTTVAGTAIEAAQRKADLAVVIVHEFRTENMNEASRARNAEDFAAFVGVLCDVQGDEVTHGRLYGPATLAQGKHLTGPVDVFIGKAVFDWSPTTGL